MPATSAAPRCAASTLSKNRFPGFVGQPSAPTPRPALRTSAVFRCRETLAGTLPEFPPPPVQHVGIHLQRPSRFGDRNPLFQPPYGRQFELFGELPTRQSHDSILHSMDFES